VSHGRLQELIVHNMTDHTVLGTLFADLLHLPSLAAERTSVVLTNAGHKAVLAILDTDSPGEAVSSLPTA